MRIYIYIYVDAQIETEKEASATKQKPWLTKSRTFSTTLRDHPQSRADRDCRATQKSPPFSLQRSWKQVASGILGTTPSIHPVTC